MSKRGSMCGGDVGIRADFGPSDDQGRVKCPGCRRRVKLKASPLHPGRFQIPPHFTPGQLERRKEHKAWMKRRGKA